jgi:hypothetical protein
MSLLVAQQGSLTRTGAEGLARLSQPLENLAQFCILRRGGPQLPLTSASMSETFPAVATQFLASLLHERQLVWV